MIIILFLLLIQNPTADIIYPQNVVLKFANGPDSTGIHFFDSGHESFAALSTNYIIFETEYHEGLVQDVYAYRSNNDEIVFSKFRDELVHFHIESNDFIVELNGNKICVGQSVGDLSNAFPISYQNRKTIKNNRNEDLFGTLRINITDEDGLNSNKPWDQWVVLDFDSETQLITRILHWEPL